MITKTIVTLLLTLLVLTGCNKKEHTQENKQAKQQTKTKENSTSVDAEAAEAVQRQKNELDLQDIDGNKHHVIADYRGLIFDKYKDKVLVLDFFATWCPPCRAEIPHLINLQKKYGNKVQFISILMEKGRDNIEIKEFADEYGFNFPIMNSKDNILLSQALGGIKSLPTLVIFNKRGEYYSHFLGAAPEEMLAAKIDEVLAK